MRYNELRAEVRAARRRRGLTQAELSARSGTSRVTIARFEAGGDLRVGTLAGLCEALDLELTVAPKQENATAALETRLARERDRSRRETRRYRHARLAARLLSSPRGEGCGLVEQARRVVDRWEAERLCSRHYVTRWRRILRGSPAQVAARLLEPGDWRDALYQNSPWSFAFRREASTE